MSYRSRLSNFALGVAALSIIVLLAFVVGELVRRNAILQELSGQIEQSKSNSQHTPSNNFDQLTSAIDDQADANQYKPNCANKEDANLCAQLQMAKAAELEAWYAKLGFWLLVGTLGAAIWAALEAKSAAGAGWKTVDVSEDTGNRQLRAYLNVLEGKLIYARQERLRVHLAFKNYGSTPAYKVINRIQAKFSTTALTEFSIDEENHRGNQGVVGPTSSFTSVLPLDDPPLPPDKMDMLKKNQAILYVFGIVTYEDAFGFQRYTKYRLMFGGEAEVLEDLSLAICPEGNEAT